MGTELVKVGFQGDEIEVVRDGADVWVSVRRVCAALGLANQPQQAKLATKPWACVTSIVTQVPGDQARCLFMLHLDSLPMWLATIEPARVKPEHRAKLTRYQMECARVLRDHFFGAKQEAPTVAAPLPAIAGIVRESPPLLRDLRRLVGASARMTNVSERKVRGWMVRASGAASYLRMPLAYGAFLREQLMRVALGEDAAPWSLRHPQLTDGRQQLFPPPIGEAAKA